MAEENKGVEAQKQEQQTAAPQLTEIELKAQEQGWVPQDAWDGEPDQWRPAKEFLDRGELFKKIDEQKRELKEFKRTLEEFGKHHARVRKMEYERALADLKAQKKAALEELDADKVVELDEKIDAVREAQKQPDAPTVQSPPEQNPVFVSWVQRNGWYNNNEAMRAYADRLGNRLGSMGMDANTILSEVEKAVKKEFAAKFENPRRSSASAVEGTSGKGGPSKKDEVELSPKEQKMMENFIKNIPGMTKEKYLKEYNEAKARGF